MIHKTKSPRIGIPKEKQGIFALFSLFATRGFLLVLLTLTAYHLPLTAFLYAGSAGTCGAQFLKLGVGARPVGMGEAFVAVANDVSAMFWNPAGLARLSSKEVSATHHSYIQAVNYESFAYAHPSKIGTFGTGMNYLYLNDIERRGKNEELQGNFGASDMALTFSFARPLLSKQKRGDTPPSRQFSAGFNFKFIRQQIDSYNANAVAFDVGILTPFRHSNFTIGLALQNIGSQVRFVDRSYSLPRTLRAGLSWTPAKAPVTLSGAVSIPQDNSPSYQLGGEYWLIQSFALRSGYLIRPKNDTVAFKGLASTADRSLSQFAGFMAGAGLKFFNVQIDYAFVPLGDLGNTHRVTLGMRFK